MRTAIEDVHHRDRQVSGFLAAEILVQRHVEVGRGRLGHGQRRAQNRVGAQARLVLRAVELNQGLIDLGLTRGIQADERLPDLGVDVLYGLPDTLSQVPPRVAVAQLDGFPLPRGRTRWHGGASQGTTRQDHVHLNGRIAATIEDLVGDNLGNLLTSHSAPSFSRVPLQ